MQFAVQIQGMTCNGCRKGVHLGLEEHFSSVSVDLATGEARFEATDSDSARAGVEAVARELDHYRFSEPREA